MENLGLIPTQATRPPPWALSLDDSSKTMISKSPFLKLALWIKGSIWVFSQPSAVAKEQSWASLHRLGVIKEYAGRALLVRSLANCLNGTRFNFCVGLLSTSER